LKSRGQAMKEQTEARIICPVDGDDGKLLTQALAFPWHLIGKTCKKCNLPLVEHRLLAIYGPLSDLAEK
jgi:hypothetical protein